ncbi:4-carboxy-4-hydroxy-2-oxoadipate aldolase/oxaloacetate decarboxylase [Paraburkholderia sp. LEh10]|jgi:4-hydroxy-4-methyl-2-oxoglutarate aldolase|uniref:4-carboxy-4-hydroxy-2-oxoadipate aldolase/oxaloacetate decarboxylase n=1 Tax=Paraburkholderia sp. LEh10 TaxID=2821353 RepID=UPI001AE99270|nr:4-carboxy-4-hydroxy-2-oxoadipate aldolase/oxaloacetate decarboxylase [Paraburkholderia sp. LEh10]MBP0594899.1 4-carboxy-4-hydroxy-2-oxoadipate aldolase/oxaloacetate decarboxylase [Paraburkholderia sp. LEh10]
MSASFICAPGQFPTVRTSIERPEAHLVAQASGMPSSTLHEALGRIGALPSSIKPVAPAMRICGPAVVVHAPGGDNLWLHRALYIAEPGDVLVVHVSGKPDFGYWGEIMSTAACERELGGLVIDGCVRDADQLEALGFPVFSTGLSIRGTGKDQGARGWINHPVRLGDVVVKPGDLIVGDRDGVVAVPRERVQEAVSSSAAREAKEITVMQRLRSGERTLELYNF